MNGIDHETDIPTVLVVEDEAELLMSRLRQLAKNGVVAVGSRTVEDAAAFVVASVRPLSLAIIDVNLRPDDPSDRSGLALARLLSDSGMGMPVVGYSAHFEDGAISERDRSSFQAWIDKGRLLPDQIADRYAELAQDVAAAAHGSLMERTTRAADAVIDFLALTRPGADVHVVEARAFLRSAVGARAYDPLDGSSSYDPLSDHTHAVSPVPALPSTVTSALTTITPDGASR